MEARIIKLDSFLSERMKNVDTHCQMLELIKNPLDHGMSYCKIRAYNDRIELFNDLTNWEQYIDNFELIMKIMTSFEGKNASNNHEGLTELMDHKVKLEIANCLYESAKREESSEFYSVLSENCSHSWNKISEKWERIKEVKKMVQGFKISIFTDSPNDMIEEIKDILKNEIILNTKFDFKLYNEETKRYNKLESLSSKCIEGLNEWKYNIKHNLSESKKNDYIRCYWTLNENRAYQLIRGLYYRADGVDGCLVFNDSSNFSNWNRNSLEYQVSNDIQELIASYKNKSDNEKKRIILDQMLLNVNNYYTNYNEVLKHIYNIDYDFGKIEAKNEEDRIIIATNVIATILYDTIRFSKSIVKEIAKYNINMNKLLFSHPLDLCPISLTPNDIQYTYSLKDNKKATYDILKSIVKNLKINDFVIGMTNIKEDMIFSNLPEKAIKVDIYRQNELTIGEVIGLKSELIIIYTYSVIADLIINTKSYEDLKIGKNAFIESLVNNTIEEQVKEIKEEPKKIEVKNDVVKSEESTIPQLIPNIITNNEIEVEEIEPKNDLKSVILSENVESIKKTTHIDNDMDKFESFELASTSIRLTNEKLIENPLGVKENENQKDPYISGKIFEVNERWNNSNMKINYLFNNIEEAKQYNLYLEGKAKNPIRVKGLTTIYIALKYAIQLMVNTIKDPCKVIPMLYNDASKNVYGFNFQNIIALNVAMMPQMISGLVKDGWRHDAIALYMIDLVCHELTHFWQPNHNLAFNHLQDNFRLKSFQIRAYRVIAKILLAKNLQETIKEVDQEVYAPKNESDQNLVQKPREERKLNSLDIQEKIEATYECLRYVKSDKQEKYIDQLSLFGLSEDKIREDLREKGIKLQQGLFPQFEGL